MTPTMRTLKTYAPEILSTGLALTVAFTSNAAIACTQGRDCGGEQGGDTKIGVGVGVDTDTTNITKVGVKTDNTNLTNVGVNSNNDNVNKNILVGGENNVKTSSDATSNAIGIGKASVGDTKATAVTGDQKQTLVGGNQNTSVKTGPSTATSSSNGGGGGNVNYKVEAEKAVTLRVGIGTPTPAQLPSGPDLAGTMCYTVDTKTGWATPIVTTPGESHTKPNIECVSTVTDGNVQIERLRAASPVGVQLAARNCRVGVGAFYALLNTSSGDASSYCDVQPVAKPLPAPRNNRGTGKTIPKPDCRKELGGCKNELTDLKKANDALNYRIGQLEKGMAVPLPTAPATPTQNPPAATATPQ